MISFFHTASCYRVEVDRVQGQRQKRRVLVKESFSCLMEPLSARQKEMFAGRVSEPRLRASWPGDWVQEGDEIEFEGCVYQAVELQRDIFRRGGIIPAYSTCILGFARKV